MNGDAQPQEAKGPVYAKLPAKPAQREGGVEADAVHKCTESGGTVGAGMSWLAHLSHMAGERALATSGRRKTSTRRVENLHGSGAKSGLLLRNAFLFT